MPGPDELAMPCVRSAQQHIYLSNTGLPVRLAQAWRMLSHAVRRLASHPPTPSAFVLTGLSLQLQEQATLPRSLHSSSMHTTNETTLLCIQLTRPHSSSLHTTVNYSTTCPGDRLTLDAGCLHLASTKIPQQQLFWVASRMGQRADLLSGREAKLQTAPEWAWSDSSWLEAPTSMMSRCPSLVPTTACLLPGAKMAHRP